MAQSRKAIDRLPAETIDRFKQLWLDKSQTRADISLATGLSIDTLLALREQLGLPKRGQGVGGGRKKGQPSVIADDPDGVAARTLEVQMQWSEGEWELRRRDLENLHDLAHVAPAKAAENRHRWQMREI